LGLNRAEAEAALTEAGLACGLPLREVQGVLAWALPRGEARPLDLEDRAPISRKPLIFRNTLAENPGPSLSQETIFRNPALHTGGLRKRRGVVR